MTPEEYSTLYRKFLAGKCTPQERDLLLTYEDEINIQHFHNEEGLRNDALIKAEIYGRLAQQMKPQRNRFKLFSWKYAVAASILILLSIGLFRYLDPKHETSALKGSQLAVKKTMEAGGNRATLTLSNGKEIDLTKIAKGTVYESAAVKITKTSSGAISYQVLATATEDGQAQSFHTIRTPRGGEYQLVLQDGTKVWLNAVSSLRFPNKFIGSKRNVELIGEAYFEVAKNREMPFSVTVKNTRVNVLGTHFNIMGYPEDPSIQTTLLEGAVELSTAKQVLLLAPGEQGTVVSGKDEISKRKVNAEDMIAWKNGYFVFKKESIKTIMSKVARWYGAEIIYQGDVEHIRLGGTVSRAEEISDLLARLELTGAVNFKIEGRKIYVVSATKL